MKILDRYIIRQFLINFVILTMALMSLFVLVDMLLDFDEFLAAGEARAGRFGSVLVATVYSIVDYYYPMTLLLFVFLAGLLVAAAMGFTIWGLARAGEVVAMVASGISMYRVAAPILVVGCSLNMLSLPVQEYLIPALAEKLARGKNQVASDTVRTFELRFAYDGKGDLFTAEKFEPATQTLTHLTILERDPQTGAILREICAQQGMWDQDAQAWRLSRDATATWRPTGAERPRAPEALAAFASDLSPKLILARRATIYPRLLSLGELNEMAKNPAADGALLTQIMQGRFSLMVVNMLILVMALPFFLLREPTPVMKQAIKAIGLCLAAWGLAIVVMQVNSGYLLSPYTAAWLPVVIYLPLSALLLQRIKT
jgi:lipopolysaccharide export LptBFGC system permease protein LptF